MPDHPAPPPRDSQAGDRGHADVGKHAALADPHAGGSGRCFQCDPRRGRRLHASGETAVGEYPCETVEMMNRIALAAEPLCSHRAEENGSDGAEETCPAPHRGTDSHPLNPVTKVVVCEAEMLAEKLAAKLIIVASASGATALSLAKNRFSVPTVGVSDSPATLRRICLYWGITPLASGPAARWARPGPRRDRLGQAQRIAQRRRLDRAHRRDGHQRVDAQHDRRGQGGVGDGSRSLLPKGTNTRHSAD